MLDRMKMLGAFSNAGSSANAAEVHPLKTTPKSWSKTRALIDERSDGRVQAYEREAQNVRERYGNDQLRPQLPDGTATRRDRCARSSKLNFGGWDLHNGCFTGPRKRKLPELDQAMSALVADLAERGRLCKSTVVLWMGEFGRTPRINGNAGRDHWARAWSVVVGGGAIEGGRVIGATNEDGTRVETDPFSSEDLMATVCQGLGISLKTTFTSKNGRPMKIANGGSVIPELFA